VRPGSDGYYSVTVTPPPFRRLLLVAALILAAISAPAASALGRGAGVYVAGTRLVDAAGVPLVLRGVNHAGTEYACSQGWGIFDGPVDDASIRAMTAWHVHVVRIPLNEDCWLGINGVKPAYGGRNYRSAIRGYVSRLEAHGVEVILDLHWNAPGRQLARGQQVMADADHSPAFWHSVAESYRNDHRVMFELYNEPNHISWSCWRNGCTTKAGWRAAGMQSLVNAVRSAGATNVVIVGGLGWSTDLSLWRQFAPTDPLRQMAAAFHAYNFAGCNTKACWTATVAQVAKHVPVVATEFGENDCSGRYVDSLMSWFDAHHVSYLGWTWNTWDCRGGPALIRRTDGTPTSFGSSVRAHLRAFR
jgi:hypothetical protein